VKELKERRLKVILSALEGREITVRNCAKIT
jgi:hypothetical protein